MDSSAEGATGYAAWVNLVRFIAYFFSLRSLVRTLFAGWHRDTSEEFEWWQRLILEGIFIVVGACIRLFFIALGLVAMALSLLALPVLLVIPIRLSYERLVKIGSIGKSWSYGFSPALHKYGKVLDKGHDVKLYGREGVVESVERILSRAEKDNVLLIGPPGVGKETILAQFAKDVYRGLVPEKLRSREVIEIPLADVQLTAIQKMFTEAREAGNIIAVLHEPEKYQGILDEIMPLLAAEELQVIVVTTLEGYVGGLRDRADVIRYFERVDVPALSGEATLEFLHDYVAEHYGAITFEEGVLEEIIRRTDELIETKTQPEKSVDLLQELVVGTSEVTIAAVDHLLSQKTGVPLGALERDERQALLTLEDTLKKEIIDQDEAVHDIASALRRARTGVASKGKPIGSFLFLGPTGSGKTHTARMLARHYFGGEGVMIRFDMSEFALSGSETAFIERLALAAQESPYSLVFFDELEKADRVIWNALLQVLDEGRLTTGRGKTVSFKNTIIIATSNAGTVLIEEHPETTKKELMQALISENIFSPEFLNRFDDVVLFHPLTREDAAAVTRLLLAELNVRLAKERGVTVAVTDTLVQGLVMSGFDQQNGARALRRAVQDKVENAVADVLLREQPQPGSVLTIG